MTQAAHFLFDKIILGNSVAIMHGDDAALSDLTSGQFHLDYRPDNWDEVCEAAQELIALGIAEITGKHRGKGYGWLKLTENRFSKQMFLATGPNGDRGDWLKHLRELRILSGKTIARADDVRAWWHQENPQAVPFSEWALGAKTRQARGR